MDPAATGSADPLGSRSGRARRRRRRRVFGTAIFVLAAIGVFVAAYLTVSGSGDSGRGRASDQAVGTTAGPTTTTTPPPAGPFVLTDGVNVRTGPGTKYPSRGTIEKGNKVMVVCVIDGETVNGPKGPTNKWDRITGTTPVGYVTDEYVDTGPAIANPAIIPVCTGI
jgi:hypothetical protein